MTSVFVKPWGRPLDGRKQHNVQGPHMLRED